MSCFLVGLNVFEITCCPSMRGPWQAECFNRKRVRPCRSAWLVVSGDCSKTAFPRTSCRIDRQMMPRLLRTLPQTLVTRMELVLSRTACRASGSMGCCAPRPSLRFEAYRTESLVRGPIWDDAQVLRTPYSVEQKKTRKSETGGLISRRLVYAPAVVRHDTDKPTRGWSIRKGHGVRSLTLCALMSYNENNSVGAPAHHVMNSVYANEWL